MLGPKFITREPGAPPPPPSQPRVAVYDLGSNSFRVLVAAAGPDGNLTVLVDTQEIVRLGADSLRDGAIPFASFQRGLHALRKLRELADPFRPDNTVAVATSAIREARNGMDFVNHVQIEVGLTVEVLDPVKEATLIYWGARQALDLEARRVALFDVGGGSTKALVGSANECQFATSLPMGVLRLRDQWQGGVVGRAEILTAETRVRAVMQPSVRHMQKLGFDFVTFTSGTALALARLAEGDGNKMAPVQGRSGEGLGRHLLLSLDSLKALEQRLAAATDEERAAMPGVNALRADTLLPGTIVLRTLLELTGQYEAIVCESALKEGLVVDYFARHNAGLAEPLPEEV